MRDRTQFIYSNERNERIKNGDELMGWGEKRDGTTGGEWEDKKNNWTQLLYVGYVYVYGFFLSLTLVNVHVQYENYLFCPM